jgi:hypothetical protein
VNRSGRFVVALAALGLLAALLAGGAGAAAPRAQVGMLLRLHELPGGYTVDEEFGCAGLSPEGADPPLESFLGHHLVGACEARYERRFARPGKGPDPPLAVSVVFDLGTVKVAEEAGPLLPELVGRWTGNITAGEARAPASIGVDTRLFHGRADVLGHPKPGSAITWRQGDLIGMTLIAGEGRATDDNLAAHFARLQRGHMKKPTPYPASGRDDVTVPLENPAITLPIYWLGRSFVPGAGPEPPLLKLTDASGPLLEGEAPPGTKLELWYGEGAIRIGTWTPQSWAAYTAGKLGRELLTWHCTKQRSLPVAEGTATIYSGYEKDLGSCPKAPPNVFAAVVERGGVVLGMNLPACYTCLGGGGGPNGAELEAAVAALRPFRPGGR